MDTEFKNCNHCELAMVTDLTEIRIEQEKIIRRLKNYGYQSTYLDKAILDQTSSKMFLGKVMGDIEGQKSVDIEYKENGEMELK